MVFQWFARSALARCMRTRSGRASLRIRGGSKKTQKRTFALESTRGKAKEPQQPVDDNAIGKLETLKIALEKLTTMETSFQKTLDQTKHATINDEFSPILLKQNHAALFGF